MNILAATLYIAVVISSLGGLAFAAPASGDIVSGFATQYGGKRDGGDPNKPVYGLLDGACGYGEFSKTEWPNWQVAAISQSNPIATRGQPQKRGCGACIEVACNSTACTGDGSLTVLVTDDCKDCKPQQININALAFERHISSVSGSVDVVWRQVPCRPPGNIQAKVLDASGSYIRFVLLQVAGESGFSNVEIQGNGQSNWVTPNGDWGTQLQTSSAGQAPYSLRLTPRDGSPQIIARNAIPAAKTGTYDTGVQLPAGSPLPPLASALASPSPVINPPRAAPPLPLLQPTAANATAPAVINPSAPVIGAAALLNSSASAANVPPGAAAVNASQQAARDNPFLPFRPVPPNALNRPPGDTAVASAPVAGVPAQAPLQRQTATPVAATVLVNAPVQPPAAVPVIVPTVVATPPAQPPTAVPVVAPIVAPSKGISAVPTTYPASDEPPVPAPVLAPTPAPILAPTPAPNQAVVPAPAGVAPDQAGSPAASQNRQLPLFVKPAVAAAAPPVQAPQQQAVASYSLPATVAPPAAAAAAGSFQAAPQPAPAAAPEVSAPPAAAPAAAGGYPAGGAVAPAEQPPAASPVQPPQAAASQQPVAVTRSSASAQGPSQPSMSLTLDPAAVNLTGSDANAPAINAEVGRILDPQISLGTSAAGK
ncbi:hypothetical protein COCSUDRAFT_46000 [Coccomyxa subellipsoidea C-169]|uniref:Expansin-like EG45 domain-containing protein n=1 Tax=Coccomyxa subellipsoidea (strain C-169) TaxID=574566 RepID=I0ZAY1_COCSC|nr:hypothetical protein COCSUDRAFT_46000 [Coccomyxa subellipsoidea C-169]EIE27800.1 hypothetical protein COCSUDRAFT_46000 [Coccomyxa subellipsoidea C-169]|eukprot:XP_005652344.1 hypothetical protein COCSUDRAFT_46000 [Coccomyxa subellipsoidea C-169]